jgi:iron-sulfur cluster insertion protein
MLTVTESAQKRISEIQEQNPGKSVVLIVDGGGCAGFSYRFDIVEELDSEMLSFANLHVDPVSHGILEGSTVDFKNDLVGSYFSVDIPQATSSCGCGTSFSI